MTFVLTILGVFLLVGSGLGLSAYYIYRHKLRKSKAIERGLKMVPILIHLPPATNQGASNRDAKEVMREKTAQAEVLYNLLAGTAVTGFRSTFYGQRHVAMELIAIDGVVHFYAAVPVAMASTMEQALQTAYPGARMEMVEDHNIFNREGRLAATMGGEMVLRTESAYPIATYSKLDRDPMEALLTSISALDKQDGVAFQLMLRPAASNWISRSLRVADMKRRGRGAHNDLSVTNLAQAALKAPSARAEEDKQYHGGQTASQIEQDTANTIEEKTKHPGFEVLIRVIVSTGSVARSQQLLRDIATTFALYDSPGHNGFTFLPAVDVQGLVTAFIFRFFPPELKGSVLNSVELATLFHLPDSQYLPAASIERQKSKQVDGPVKLPSVGLLFGYNEFRGVRKEIRLSAEDRRRHTYILGQTGVGKSTMLENLAVQDMLAGNGFAFIDPHGDSAEKLLALVPKERAEDVIYFDPGDSQYPLGLNLFEFSDPAQKDFLVQETINMLYKLYDPGKTGIIGPRYEHWYRNAALTLMSDPNGSTFIEIPKVFTDTEYLKEKFKYLKDPTVIDFWTKEMGQTSDYHKSEMLGWFVSKFGAFQNNEMMRNIIGQTKSSFNIREVMDQKKILIVNLSKGRVGELNSQLLGMIFVIKFQAAAMSRANMPEDQRSDFCLYVDEFQNFSTDSFSSILSEARKYRLNLIVANQFIGQLKPEIRDAVFGNIGSIVAHRMGPEDAEFMVKQFAPVFDTADLMNLPNYNAAMRLMISGLPSQPFTMVDSPPIGKPNAELGAAVKQLSAAKYGHDRAVVEADIASRLTSTRPGVTPPVPPTPPAPPVPPTPPAEIAQPQPVQSVPAPAPVVQAPQAAATGAPPDPKVLGAAPTDPMTLVMETHIPPTAVVTNGATMDDSTASSVPGQRHMTALEAAQARIQSGSAIAMPAADPAVVTQPMRQPQPLPQQLPQPAYSLSVSSALANEPIQSVATAVPAALPIASMQTRSGALVAAAAGGGAGMARPAPPIGAPPVNLDPILTDGAAALEPLPPEPLLAESVAAVPPPVVSADTLSIRDIVGSPNDVAILEPGVMPPGGVPVVEPVAPEPVDQVVQPDVDLNMVGSGEPLAGDPYAEIDVLGSAARRPTMAPLPKPAPNVAILPPQEELLEPAVQSSMVSAPEQVAAVPQVIEPEEMIPVAVEVPAPMPVEPMSAASMPMAPISVAPMPTPQETDTEYIHFVDPAAEQVLARNEIPAPIIEAAPETITWQAAPVITEPDSVVAVPPSMPEPMPVAPIITQPAPLPEPVPIAAMVPAPAPVITEPIQNVPAPMPMAPAPLPVVPTPVVAPLPTPASVPVPTPTSVPVPTPMPVPVPTPVPVAPVTSIPVIPAPAPAPVAPPIAQPSPVLPPVPAPVLSPQPTLPPPPSPVVTAPAPVVPSTQPELIQQVPVQPVPQPVVQPPALPPIPAVVQNIAVPKNLESVAQMLTESATEMTQTPKPAPVTQKLPEKPKEVPKAVPVPVSQPTPVPVELPPEKPMLPPVPIPFHKDLEGDVVAAMPALAPSQATVADERTAQNQLADAQHEIDDLLTESLIRLEGRRERLEPTAVPAIVDAPVAKKVPAKAVVTSAPASDPVAEREHKSLVIAPVHADLDKMGPKIDPQVVAQVMQGDQPKSQSAPVVEKVQQAVVETPNHAVVPPPVVEPKLPDLPPVPVITKHARGLLPAQPPAVNDEPESELPTSESLAADDVAKARAEREVKAKLPQVSTDVPKPVEKPREYIKEPEPKEQPKPPEKVQHPVFRSRTQARKVEPAKGEKVASTEEAQHNTPSETAQDFGPLTGKVIMPTGEKPITVSLSQPASKPAKLAPGEVFVDEKGNVSVGE